MRNGADVPDHVIVLGMMVVGTAGERTEEVYCLDMQIACAQNDVFRMAGYSNVMLIPTYFVFDNERNCYPVTIRKQVELAERTVAARYSRADINPGIPVDVYDRDVLKRRPTGLECLACIVGAIGAMLAISGFIAMLATLIFEPKGNVDRFIVPMGSWIVTMLILILIPWTRDKIIAFGGWIGGIKGSQ